MTPDTSKARKLIEEAKDRMRRAADHIEHHAGIRSYCSALDLLDEALTLLPSWQEFDPQREETWPKEKKWCAVWINAGEREPILDVFFWRGMPWNAPVICYYVLPLPPPYRSAVKENDAQEERPQKDKP